MIREDDDQVAVQSPGLALADQLLETVRLAGDERGHALALGRPAGQADRHLHVDLLADPAEPEDELVERGLEVGQVDEHRHDEETLHHALLDVLDVDVRGGEVGGDARDHALLVAADDRDDGAAAVAHRHPLSRRAPRRARAATRAAGPYAATSARCAPARAGRCRRPGRAPAPASSSPRASRETPPGPPPRPAPRRREAASTPRPP